MSYRFPSSFYSIVAYIADLPDAKSISASISAKAHVQRLLDSRVREERHGTGALRADFARERISSDISKLENFRDHAVDFKASTEFIEMIDLALRAAREACAAAPIRGAASATPPSTAEPAKPAWRSGQLQSDLALPLLNFDDV